MKNSLYIFGIACLLTACDTPEPASVQGHTYLYTTAPTNMEITLAFAPNEERFFGKAVNRYFGTYRIKDDSLTLGPISSTMMMGLDSEMTVEKEYFDKLSHVTGFSVTPETLTLILTDKSELTFQRTD